MIIQIILGLSVTTCATRTHFQLSGISNGTSSSAISGRGFSFDFAFLNQPLLFCLNLLIQFFARAFLRPLLHELTLYRQL